MSVCLQFPAGRGVRARRLDIVFAALAAALVFMLAACSGGGGSSEGSGGNAPPPPPPPPALVIVSQPADQTVVAGAAATFDVKASVPATFQWQRQDTDTWHDIAGATQATLAIAATQAADDGSHFRVVVTNLANEADLVTSSTVLLTVTPAPQPPVVTVAPSDLSLVAGQEGQMSVTATGTSLAYRWQRSADGTAFADIADATSATLVLAKVALADDGAAFRAIVSNDLGSVTSGVARLHVTPAPAAPVFTRPPADATAIAGLAATFSVAVTGLPAPTLAWQASADGTQWNDLADQHGASLVLASVALGDDGKHFRAVATNPSGSVASPSATLHVTPAPLAPFITTQPTDASVGEGGTPAFRVVAGGMPAPAYQWQVSANGGASFANVNGATTADLVLAPVAAADNGKQWRVVVQNASGSVTSSVAVLTVRPGPEIVRHPEAQAWRSGLVEPLFQVVANGTGLSFQWQIRVGSAAAYTDIPGATTDTVTVTPPADDAQVRVVVTNPAGDSSTSLPAALMRLRWAYVSPTPTGDTMRGLHWIDAGTVVGVGDNGTILRSVDAGLSWTTMRETDSAHANSLYGVDFGSAKVGVAVGDNTILRTTDGGLHWLTVSSAQFGGVPLRAVAFSDAQTVVALSGNGGDPMFRSTDAGATWTSVDTGPVSGFTSIAFRAGVGIAAAYDGHVLRSINGGAQWADASPAPLRTLGMSGVAFASDSTVVVAAQNSIARSTDAGLTWTASSPGVYYASAAVGFRDASNGVALPLMGVGGAWVTSDGGATWAPSPSWPDSTQVPGTPPEGSAIAFGPTGIGIAAGSWGTLRRTTDAGQTWTELDASAIGGFDDLDNVAFGSATIGVATGQHGLYQTTDGGAHWTAVGANVSPAGTTWLGLDFVGANTVYALDSNGHTAASFDAGATWTPRGNAGSSFGYFGNITFRDSATGLAATGDGLARTTDGGVTWAILPGISTCYTDVVWLDASTAVAIECGGWIRRSTDGGLTWPLAGAGNSYAVSRVAFADASTGIAVDRNAHAVRTTDGGITWQDAPLPSTLVEPARPWFVSPTEGYIFGHHEPLYRTTDGGLTWTMEQVSRLDHMDGAGALASNLQEGVALDAQTSLVVGGHGVVMKRTP